MGTLPEKIAAPKPCRKRVPSCPSCPAEAGRYEKARAFLPRVALSIIQLFQPLLIAPYIQIIKAPLPDTDAALAFNQLHDGAMARG
jgi:hypothetical protein